MQDLRALLEGCGVLREAADFVEGEIVLEPSEATVSLAVGCQVRCPPSSFRPPRALPLCHTFRLWRTAHDRHRQVTQASCATQDEREYR